MNKQPNVHRDDSGLSLIEVVIAVVLFAVIAGVFYGLIVNVTRGWGAVQGQLDVQQNPRLAVTRITAEIEQARDFMIDTAGTTLSVVKGTVLAADVAAGATTFTVEDATVLAAPSCPSGPGNACSALLLNVLSFERVYITSITGNSVTISSGLTRAHKQGEAVRRDQSTRAGPPSSGQVIIGVGNGEAFKVGDTIAVGSEAPFTITGIFGGLLTITPATGQTHYGGEVVQIVTVVFKLQTGTNQLTRCTTGCNNSANEIVLADYAAAQSGAQLFAATYTSLSAAAARASTSITVSNTAGFAVNDLIQIGRDLYAAGTTGAITPPDRKRIRVIAAGAPGSLTLCSATYTAGASCPSSGNGSSEGLTADRAINDPARVNAVTISILGTRINPLLGGQTQESMITAKVGLRN